jgi:hypothetical protein
LLFGLATSCSSAPTEPLGQLGEATREAAQAVAFVVTCSNGAPPPPAPDLVVDKTVVAHGGDCPGTDPFVTPLGSQVDYCLTVSNNGALPVFNLIALDDDGTFNYTVLTQLLIDAGLGDANGDGRADVLNAGQSVTIHYGPITFNVPGGQLVTDDIVRVGFSFAAGSNDMCAAYYMDPSTIIDGPACVQQPASCDDGDGCTTDTCDPITGCTHLPIVCDDGDACTTDVCDPQAGTCSNYPAVNGTACDDGNACTQGETCQGGACGAPALVCPAGFSSISGGCQKTYDIDWSLLDNQGSNCDDTETNWFNGCNGAAYGFHWIDEGAGLAGVPHVTVRFEQGMACAPGNRVAKLNGVAVASFDTVGSCSCFSPHATVDLGTLDAGAYVVGGMPSLPT